jgi:hypothetical protein
MRGMVPRNEDRGGNEGRYGVIVLNCDFCTYTSPIDLPSRKATRDRALCIAAKSPPAKDIAEQISMCVSTRRVERSWRGRGQTVR